MSTGDYEHQYPNGHEDDYYDSPDIDDKANQLYEKKSKRPRYFPSNKPQTLIRNAVTGVEYPYLVGSKEQSLLYKIVDATGTCDPDGYMIRLRTNLPNPNTNHLFYDSPEQCMNHLHYTLNPDHIKQWHDRRTNN
jgi:hypothetical protein